jgi:hypothetical protein
LDALYRSLENSAKVASLAVVVDAIDEAARGFYSHYGFILFPSHTDRLYLPMASIQKLFP